MSVIYFLNTSFLSTHEEMAHGQDEELARLEEEAARKLQERMAAELEDLPVEDLLPQVSVAPDVPASQGTVLCICGCEGE